MQSNQLLVLSLLRYEHYLGVYACVLFSDSVHVGIFICKMFALLVI